MAMLVVADAGVLVKCSKLTVVIFTLAQLRCLIAGCQPEPCLSLQLLAELAASGACADAVAAVPWASMKDASSFMYPAGQYESADTVALAALCSSLAAAAKVDTAKGVAGASDGATSHSVALAVARCLTHPVSTCCLCLLVVLCIFAQTIA
jgi:hypothetical protein